MFDGTGPRDIPLIAVTEAGGVHLRESYEAGWEMGALAARPSTLTSLAAVIGEIPPLSIRTDNQQQAELIAIALGCTARFQPTLNPHVVRMTIRVIA